MQKTVNLLGKMINHEHFCIFFANAPHKKLIFEKTLDHMHTFVKVLVFYAFLFTQKLRATVLLAKNAIFKPTTPNGSKPLFFTHICLPKNDEQQFY